MKFFFIIPLIFFCNAQAQILELANSGNSAYKIILPKTPNQNEVLAASEFQRYFKTITGINLSIQNKENLQQEKSAILIGNSKRFTNLKTIQNDGVIIKTEGSNLMISGGESRGVLYGVYTFFEKYLDCKFYATDEVKIPKKKTIKIKPIDYQYSSPFIFRSYCSLENEDKLYADFNKQNYFFENRLYFAHSLAWLLPADKYFDKNPDFFAQIDGKRNKSQICFSSEKALEELINVLGYEIASNTNNVVWSVSHLDSPRSCECNKCKKAYSKGNGFSETLIPFVNKVARAFPDKIISTLAYNQSLFPSKTEKPEKNVEIMFCFTQTDRRYSLASSENKEAKKFIDALRMWKLQTDNFFFWDYSVNYFHSLYPFPNIHNFQPDLQYFSNLGVKKIFMQGIGPQKGEFSELKSYLASQLLWNPNADYEFLLDDFLKNYYGSAWQDIKNYLQLLEKESKKYSTSLDVYASPVVYKEGYLKPENILRYRNILNSALLKVKNHEKFSARVRKEILSLEYADIEIKSTNNNTSNNKLKEGFNNKLKSFQLEAKKNGIKNLRNGELTVDEFVKQKLK